MSFTAAGTVCALSLPANSESVYILYSTIFCNYYFEIEKNVIPISIFEESGKGGKIDVN